MCLGLRRVKLDEPRRLSHVFDTYKWAQQRRVVRIVQRRILRDQRNDFPVRFQWWWVAFEVVEEEEELGGIEDVGGSCVFGLLRKGGWFQEKIVQKVNLEWEGHMLFIGRHITMPLMKSVKPRMDRSLEGNCRWKLESGGSVMLIANGKQNWSSPWFSFPFFSFLVGFWFWSWYEQKWSTFPDGTKPLAGVSVC